MGNRQQKSKHGSLLQQGAARGDLEAVRHCIKIKVDVNESDEVGQSALHLASRFGHLACAQLLLANGAEANQQTLRWKWTPMHIVARYGCDFGGDKAERLIQLLLDHKGDMNQQNSSGVTPLHRANCYNQHRIVEALVSRGADLNLTTRWGHPPLRPEQRFSITSSLALQAMKKRTSKKDRSTPNTDTSQKSTTNANTIPSSSAPTRPNCASPGRALFQKASSGTPKVKAASKNRRKQRFSPPCKNGSDDRSSLSSSDAVRLASLQ